MYSNVLFDLDGTLVDSAGDIIDCLRIASSEVLGGTGLSIDKSIIGPPLRDIIKMSGPRLDAQQLEAVVSRFRHYYDNGGLSKTMPKEGVMETLRELSVNNVRMFMATNKPALPVGVIIKNLKFDCFLDIITPDMDGGASICKADMVRRIMKKWGLEREHTLMVGDTAEDVRAARESGLASAILLNGYGNRESIVGIGPEYILERFDGLLDVILNSSGKGE